MSSDNGSEDHGSTVATTSAPQTRAASNPTMTSWLAAGLSPAPVRASIAAPGAPSPLTAAQTPGMAPPPTPTSSAKIAPPAQQQQYVVPERERPPEEPWKDWEKVVLCPFLSIACVTWTSALMESNIGRTLRQRAESGRKHQSRLVVRHYPPIRATTNLGPDDGSAQ